jgi:hypothetical protein
MRSRDKAKPRPEGVACRMSAALDKPRAIFGTSN